VKSDECVYIGDQKNDIKATRASGMKIIIYSKNEFNDADACTGLFTNIPELILSLDDQPTNII